MFFFSQAFSYIWFSPLYLVLGVPLSGFWAVVYLHGRSEIKKKYNLDKILAKKQSKSLRKELFDKA